MTVVTVVQPVAAPVDTATDTVVDVDNRLRVWRERWHYAPTTDARAHAQVAIDYWLDRRLAVERRTAVDDLPAQRTVIEVTGAAIA